MCSGKLQQLATTRIKIQSTRASISSIDFSADGEGENKRLMNLGWSLFLLRGKKIPHPMQFEPLNLGKKQKPKQDLLDSAEDTKPIILLNSTIIQHEQKR